MMTAMQKAIANGPWLEVWVYGLGGGYRWLPSHVTAVAQAWANRSLIGVT